MFNNIILPCRCYNINYWMYIVIEFRTVNAIKRIYSYVYNARDGGERNRISCRPDGQCKIKM